MKHTLHLGKEDIKDLNYMSRALYGSDVAKIYGGIPKVYKFSNTFAKVWLRELAKVTLVYNESEFKELISALENIRKDLIKEKKLKDLEKEP